MGVMEQIVMKILVEYHALMMINVRVYAIDV